MLAIAYLVLPIASCNVVLGDMFLPNPIYDQKLEWFYPLVATSLMRELDFLNEASNAERCVATSLSILVSHVVRSPSICTI